ncbi:MAG TPA: YcxB family protein [Candidatus Acidoferrum sp.]|nr:YcxB family protein [Candidatus Acidoferrum sp.]
MEESKQITVEVLLRPSDVYSPFSWSWSAIIRFLLLFIAFVFLYDTFAERSSEDHTEFLRQSAWAIAFLVCAAISLFVIPYLRTLIIFRNSPALKSTRRITLSDDGMHFESTDSTGDYKWSLFAGVMETRKTFLLKQTAYAATYIPKRCFSSPEEIQIVRDLIRKNFKGKYRLRRSTP